MFEFFFKYRFLIFEKGALELRPALPWYALILVAAAAVAFSYFLYRRTGSAITGRWRFWLVALRLFPLLIMTVILLQPVLVLRTAVPQKSFLAVAYDASSSMEIRDGDGGQSRLEVEKGLMGTEAGSLLAELGKRFKLRLFRFANGAQRVEGFQDLPRHGGITDLARSLEQIIGDMGDAPVAGIVLLTDGADNRSPDLEAIAERLRAKKIPVHPVGIGSPSISRDTELVRVGSPKMVLKGASIEAEVAVRSQGYAGRRTRLTVREGERILHSQDITLGGDEEVRTHKVAFACEGWGPKIISFRVEPFDNELVRENNQQSALIRVEDQQPRILYVEGEPRWIFAFIRRAVLEDKNLRLETLLRQADGKFLRQGIPSDATLEKGFPIEKSELYEYKAVVLGSVEASFFTYDQLRLISDFVGERGGGLLMLGGKNSFGQGNYLNTPLEEVLPLNLRPGAGDAVAPVDQDKEFKVRLTNYGATHPVTRLAPEGEDNRKRWEALPSLAGYNPTGGAKPGATVLATADLGAGLAAEPVLLAFQQYGSGKSMALTSGEIWRWRMEQDHRDNFHAVFWKQLLRWLVGDVPDSVTIEPEKHSYSLDETVVLRAEAHDKAFVKLNSAQVTARITSPSGRVASVPLLWELRKEGVYSARFKPDEEGIYDVQADFRQGEQMLGSARANFRIAESYDEFHNAALNADLLRRLASDTGGRYYSPQDVRHIPEDVSYVDSGSLRLEEKDLWDMPLLYLLMIGAMAAEWALRKRKGLA